MTDDQVQALFAAGYGIVKVWSGGVYLYRHNKAHSQAQRKRLPVYVQPISASERAALDAMKRASEQRVADIHDRALSFADVARAIISTLGGEIIHRSASGSVYVTINTGHVVRISDHHVDKLDGSGEVDRWDHQVVRAGRCGIQPEHLPEIIQDVQEMAAEKPRRRLR